MEYSGENRLYAAIQISYPTISTMPSRYNQRLQILLTEDQLRFLKTTAEERGRSIAEIIREAVEIVYQPRSGFQALSALRVIADRSLLGERSWDELKNRFFGQDR